MRQLTSFSHNAFLHSAEQTFDPGNMHSYPIAIVFSALSIEVFLNEFPELLGYQGIPIKKYRNAFQVVQLAIDKRASTEIKFALTYYALAGHLPGNDPYATDVSLLFKLRNMIVHATPREYVMVEAGMTDVGLPRLVKAFVSRKIIAKPHHKVNEWAGASEHYLLTATVAKWAVKTARRLKPELAKISRDRGLRRFINKINRLNQ